MSDNEHESTSHEEESSTSEEDEDGQEWTEETERTFLKTLSSLKKKDPKIYDANVKFFSEETAKPSDNEQPSTSKKKSPKEERMYLRDYERKILLEKGGILTDEDSEDEANLKAKHRRAASPTYVDEQKALKNSFKKFLNDNEDYEHGDIAGFLKVKVKNPKEKAQEEAEYVEWLKGQKAELSDKEAEGELKYLRDYWTDPGLNEGEQFLRDYVLNKKYLEMNEENRFDSELPFSEEEEILKECDEYEQKYNFRFEEPDQDFVKTFPRVIEDSLRRKDDKRKRKREERKMRKEEQLAQKRLEVKRLKKQKKKEFLEKIEELKELTGNKTLGFDDEELERDFDPEEFDSKMNQIFNDEFYNQEGADPDLDVNNFDENNGGNELIMDCDYDPEAVRESKFKKQTRSSRRKGHKKTTFAEAVEKEKPVFDPANKTYQEYLDEYYGLDFEDVIDDLPCRYKYREVMPNDFGLTIEEILAADDKELNNWCSMKKIDTIRPDHKEKFDRNVYQKRAQDLELKKKYLPSLFKAGDNAEVAESTEQETRTKKKRKKRRKRSAPESNPNDQKTNKEDDVNCERKTPKRKHDSNSELPRNKKIKRNFDSCSTKNFKSDRDVANDKFAISDERLKAYGFNPKKYKNKIKYGGRSDR